MKLTTRQIQRLQKLRQNGPNGTMSYDLFKTAISAPFSSQTLLNAMRGKNVYPSTCDFLIGVLAKHMLEPRVLDGKSAAAGETEASESLDTPEGQNATETAQELHGKGNKRGSR